MSPELVVQLATLGTTGLLALAMWAAREQITALTTLVAEQQKAMMNLIAKLVEGRLDQQDIEAFRAQADPPKK